MSQEPEVKAARYFLRPRRSAFDLRANQNYSGLVRKSIDRPPKIVQAKSKTVHIKSSASSFLSHSPRPLPDIIKRSICLESIDINGNTNKISFIQNNKVAVIVPKVLKPPVRTTQFLRKPPPSSAPLYDVTKVLSYKHLDETSWFEIFNHLSLNDLCTMAEVCDQLKCIAQKYFEIMYTAVNLAWLSDKKSGRFTIDQAERLLINFGHLISTLTVNTKQLVETKCTEQLLELIEKHCNGGMLFWNTK